MQKIYYSLILFNSFCLAQNDVIIQTEPEDLSYLDNTGSMVLPGYQDIQVQHRPTFTDYEPKTLPTLNDMKKSSQPPIQEAKKDAVGEIIASNKKEIDIFGGFSNVTETHYRKSDGSWAPKDDSSLKGAGVINPKSTAETVKEKVKEEVDEYLEAEARFLKASLEYEKQRLNRTYFFIALLFVGSLLYFIFNKKKFY